MGRRWRQAIMMLVCGVVLAGVEWWSGSLATAIVVVVFFVGLALMVSPWAFPRSVTGGEAQLRSARDGRPIVYWRAGCPFCLRLRARLGRDGRRVYWVDIWADPGGAATVRAIANGNETVPTVVAGGESAVNPDPGWVRNRLPTN